MRRVRNVQRKGQQMELTFVTSNLKVARESPALGGTESIEGKGNDRGHSVFS